MCKDASWMQEVVHFIDCLVTRLYHSVYHGISAAPTRYRELQYK